MSEFTFNEVQQLEFLQYLRDGMMRGAAADALGINRRKVREFIAENSEFESAVLDAEVDATEHVEEALYQAAISGNVSASKTWLELKGKGAAKPAAQNQPQSPRSDFDADDLYNVEPIRPHRNRGA